MPRAAAPGRRRRPGPLDGADARDGDRLLVAYGAVPAAGRVAVVRFADGVVAVKRLDHLDADGWWVIRDNPAEGRDSWSAGRDPPAGVLAVVLARLWPRPGRLAGAGRPR